MSKRLISYLLVLIPLCTALSACGDDGNSTAPDSNGPGTSEPGDPGTPGTDPKLKCAP